MRCFFANHNLHPLFDYASFVHRNLIDCCSKRFDVVQADRSDRTYEGLHDVRCIQSSTKANLEDNYITLALLKVQERHEGGNLEER